MNTEEYVRQFIATSYVAVLGKEAAPDALKNTPYYSYVKDDDECQKAL